ncbi:uncharacterized protein AB675_5306 [Cyphellophora attinorum]|uniref:Uncharacterized protein n=1 Tax=Cyphellophora attinorum TaxID=1664694 RepID=A0A0N1HSU8_9EURO|nr:uncharacterized protein AB675_5306 [Phialophora attinorum]KPI41814.1 hypothetical protein AB675_5306 [Phialophora attinorum]
MSTDLRVVSVVATIWSALDSPSEFAGPGVLPAQIQQRINERNDATSTSAKLRIEHQSPISPSQSSVGDSPNWTSNLADYLHYFTSKYAQARAARDPHVGVGPDDQGGVAGVLHFAWDHISQGLREIGSQEALNKHLLYSRALQGLNQAVEESDILGIFGMTTLAYLDVREGPFGRWSRHLYGARGLLDLHCQDFEGLSQLYATTPGLKQAISLLLWFDVMGLVVHQDRHLIFDDFHRRDMDPVLFELVGCAQDTFRLYVEIAQGYTTAAPHQAYHRIHTQLLKVSHNPNDEKLLLQDSWRIAAFYVALDHVHPDTVKETNEAAALIADNICDIVDKILSLENHLYVHLKVQVFFMSIFATEERHLQRADSFWKFCESSSPPSSFTAQKLAAERRRRRSQKQAGLGKG